MTIISYLYDYVKTNQMTWIFLVVLLLMTSIKYIPFKKITSGKTFLILVILLGIVIRIFWLNFSSHQPQSRWNEAHMLENDIINVHAVELTKGIWFHNADGTPSGRRPIGFPMFLGLLYKIFGVNLWVAWAAQVALYALTAWLIFVLARFVFSERVALIAVLLYSFDPTSIYSIKLLTDEHLFLPFWYGGLALLLYDVNVKKIKHAWLYYGLIFGYATMIRTHTIFMPVVVGLAYFLKKYPLRKVLLSVIMVVITMQLLNLPWVVRNYKAWKVPVLYSASAIWMYSELNSTATPKGRGRILQKGDEGYSEELEQARLSGNEGLYHKISQREMMRRLSQHPTYYAGFCIARLLYFMNWNRDEGVWPLWYQYYEGSYDKSRPITRVLREFLEELSLNFYYIMFHSFLLFLILIGCRWKKLPEANRISMLILGSCFIFWFIEHMLIYPCRKYRYPLEPLMTICASVFFYYLIYEFRWENVLAKVKAVFVSKRPKLKNE